MSVRIGQSLGRYRILEQLGQGGMAVVYKAYDAHLDCEVALKVILTEQILPAALERTRKRFEREAKDVARLIHPNIVKVMDYGEEEGVPYLVLPLLMGGTLSQKLAARGRLAWKEAASLLIPIADALEYAHEHNIIHRDVKPSNILFTTNGMPMLADFGVAKVLNEDGTLDLTGTNATVGTPDYMAPEQIRSKAVDHRVDVYSLGVVYYEMVTGRRPFSGDTPIETLFKHASEPLTRPSKLVADLPVDVEDFLIKALMKNPDERFATMTEMENALQALVNGIPLRLGIQPPAPPAPTTPQVTRDETLGTVDQPVTTDQYATTDQSFTTDREGQVAPFDRYVPSAPPAAAAPAWTAPPAKKTNPIWFILGGVAVIGIVVVGIIALAGSADRRTTSQTSYSAPAYEEAPQSAAVVNDPSPSNPVIETPVPAAAQQVVSNLQNSNPAPTQRPSPTITPTEFKCPGMPVSRVKVGDKVVICSLERLGLRKDYDKESDLIRYFEPGTKFKITGGPECADGSTWWEARFDYQGTIYEGWVREGTDPKAKYFICLDNEN